MIALTALGNYERLGNQLFQYVFLRELATRLETQFYCPTWDGDAEESSRQPRAVRIRKTR